MHIFSRIAGQIIPGETCLACHGTGEVYNPPVGRIECGACDGTGSMPATPITYQARIIDGARDFITTRTGWPTSTPGLVLGEAYKPCGAHPGACWIVVHLRSGSTLQFCWARPEPAAAFAHRAAVVGRWDLNESAIVRRCRLPITSRVLARIARDLDAHHHLSRVRMTGLDNPLPPFPERSGR